jgi:hypothetical protein
MRLSRGRAGSPRPLGDWRTIGSGCQRRRAPCHRGLRGHVSRGNELAMKRAGSGPGARSQRATVHRLLRRVGPIVDSCEHLPLHRSRRKGAAAARDDGILDEPSRERSSLGDAEHTYACSRNVARRCCLVPGSSSARGHGPGQRPNARESAHRVLRAAGLSGRTGLPKQSPCQNPERLARFPG